MEEVGKRLGERVGGKGRGEMMGVEGRIKMIHIYVLYLPLAHLLPQPTQLPLVAFHRDIGVNVLASLQLKSACD